MPAGPAAFQRFCESLGIEERYRSTLFWAGLLGIPAAWWAVSGRSQPAPSQDTNINAFFKQKPATKTSVPGQSQPQRQATSFQSFLKEAPKAHRDPTSFGAFLKGPSETASDQQSPSQYQAAAPAGPQESDCAITVLFGTEYGFSKEVAERAAAAITSSGPYWYSTHFAPQLSMCRHAASMFTCCSHALFGCPLTSVYKALSMWQQCLSQSLWSVLHGSC